MIIDKNNIFFFANGDKYNLVNYNMQDLLKGDFSIYCRFKPDTKKINKIIEETGVYNGAVIAKNGKHAGIFHNGYRGDNGLIYKKIGWVFWSHDIETGTDVEKRMEFDLNWDLNNGEIEEDRYYDIVLNHNLNRKEFTLIETKSELSEKMNYDNIIDYSDSYTWIGCATLIAETHQSIFCGDISKISIQLSTADELSWTEFFTDYNSWLKKAYEYGTSGLRNVFSTDFSKRTYYKLMDMSGNGFHPVLFKNEWVDNE
jgi:hypothetical protein